MQVNSIPTTSDNEQKLKANYINSSIALRILGAAVIVCGGFHHYCFEGTWIQVFFTGLIFSILIVASFILRNGKIGIKEREEQLEAMAQDQDEQIKGEANYQLFLLYGENRNELASKLTNWEFLRAQVGRLKVVAECECDGQEYAKDLLKRLGRFGEA